MNAKIALGLLAPALLALAAGGATAAERPAEAGMVVVIDQATGKPRMPTAAEYLQFRAKSGGKPTAAAQGFRQFIRPADEFEARATLQRLPDGTEIAIVPESLTPELVAETGADGSLVIHHRGHAGHAKARSAGAKEWSHE